MRDNEDHASPGHDAVVSQVNCYSRAGRHMFAAESPGAILTREECFTRVTLVHLPKNYVWIFYVLCTSLDCLCQKCASAQPPCPNLERLIYTYALRDIRHPLMQNAFGSSSVAYIRSRLFNAECFWQQQCSIRNSLPLLPHLLGFPSLTVPLLRQLGARQVEPRNTNY